MARLQRTWIGAIFVTLAAIAPSLMSLPAEASGNPCVATSPSSIGPTIVAGQAGPVLVPAVGGPKCATGRVICIGGPCQLTGVGTADSGSGGAGVTIYIQRQVLYAGWNTMEVHSCRVGTRSTHDMSCTSTGAAWGMPGVFYRAVCVWNHALNQLDRNLRVSCGLS
jgi:hypothetical protein